MLINPNLYKEKDIVLKPKDSIYHYNSWSLKDLGIDVGKKYCLSLKCFQTDNGSGYFGLMIVNAENRIVKYKDYPINKRIEYSVEISQEMTNIKLYTNPVGKTKDIGAKFVDIKLEEGDKATLYIPNKNTIETAKRQYFIGGGYVQRGISNLVTTLSNLLLGRRLQREN